jgi:precorrin-8X/cobalt-precorrin-8 methylmutase
MQKYTKPMDIERRSFEIIEQELTTKIPDKYKPIVKRVIHTTADFSYETSLVFSESAVDVALAAIGSGTVIVTDTNMAKAGINKKAAQKNGCDVCCYMADEDVALLAAENQTTRAVMSVQKAAKCNPSCIYVVGNAPTALYEILRLHEEKKFFPKLVIGVPVGFVNVVEAKEDIIASDIPYIVARGRKGGSNVAAAIVNALMYMSLGEDRK